MAKKGKSGTGASGIRLAQPDRTDPEGPTLLDIAQERNLFAQADRAQAELRRKRAAAQGQKGTVSGDAHESAEDTDPDSLDPEVLHAMDSALWGVSLAMLHFTLDVLVHHQYAMEIEWSNITKGFAGAIVLFPVLVFLLHNHPGNRFCFGLPPRFQSRIRQMLFFTASIFCGCHLVRITNKEGYIQVMKRAPTLGCVWIWSVIEMELALSVANLAVVGVYLWYNGFSVY